MRGKLRQNLGELLAIEPIADAYLVGSFADTETSIDQDGMSDVDVYVNPKDGEVIDTRETLRAVTMKDGDGTVGTRSVDLFTPSDIDEEIDGFEDGLSLFPEAIELEMGDGDE